MVIKKKEIKCEECGARIPLKGDGGTFKCESCSTKYEYWPETKVVHKLIFQRIDRSPFEYELRSNITMGRESGKGYVEIRSVDVDSIRENTHIRNPFISRDHCKITVEEGYNILTKADSRKIVVKMRCLIEDLESTWGTKVNDVLLKPDETRELKNNDTVVLAPKSSLPLKFLYKENV